MPNPIVSVLMPAYNVKDYIKDAITSILNQSLADLELLIVDDASTDGTYEVMREFSQQDSRIKIFRNNSKQGISKNRNFLIKQAQGEFIAWQDSDDIAEIDRLDAQVKFMRDNPEVGICGGNLIFFDKTNKEISLRKYNSLDKDLRSSIFKFSPVAQPAAMIRKEVFTKVGFYKEDFRVAEDIEMSFRIGEFYKFGNLNKVVLRYRQRSDSSTFKRLKEMEKNTLKTRFKFINNSKYKFSFSDLLFNLVQLVTLYVFPSFLRIKLFNAIRNKF